MSKKFKCLVCFVLSLMLLLPVNVLADSAAPAEETQVQPRFSYTNLAFVGLDITTSGVAYCSADVEGYNGITTKVHIEMTLQKYTFLWWSNQQTWEATFNDMWGALSKTKTVSSGTYRVKAVFTVYSGSASEEITLYSQEKKISL